MATREELRARLYRKLADLLGTDEAALLMPPLPWEQIATKTDLTELRGEMFVMKGELLEKIGALDSKIGALDSKIGALDSKIGSQAWKIVVANVASSAAVAGAVVAAIRL